MDSKLEDEGENLPWNKVQEQLTCSICLEHFVKPRTLGCLHTFCEHCLDKCFKKVADVEGIVTTTISCPVCRKVVNIDENGVAGESFWNVLISTVVFNK